MRCRAGRVLSEGKPDSAFNGQAFISNAPFGGVWSVAVSGSDVFIAGGGVRFAITRYKSNGTELAPWGTTPSFADPGGESQARAMMILGGLFTATTANRVSGAMLASSGVLKYLDDAGLDPTFNAAGSRPGIFLTGELKWDVREQLTGLSVQKDGKLLLVGVFDGGPSTGSDLALLRLLPNGTPDLGFGDKGIVAPASPATRRSSGWRSTRVPRASSSLAATARAFRSCTASSLR